MDMYSRKNFIKNMVISAVAFQGFGLAAFGQSMPNEKSLNKEDGKVKVALIGFGKMGAVDLKNCLETGLVELIAVCDVFDQRLNDAKAKFGDKIKLSKDYKELLSDPNIEAVLIATPDHLHHRIAIDALKAGKHVYCEKPLIHSLEQMEELQQVHKKSAMIFQTGSQGISSWGNDFAKMIIDSGLIGTVNQVEAAFTAKPTELGMPNIPNTINKDTVDWSKFLGPGQKMEFNAWKFLRWRNWKNFSTGLAGDLFVHVIASTHYIMGIKGPKTIYSSGNLNYYLDGSRDTPEYMFSLLKYPNVNNKGDFTLALTANLVDGVSKKWGSDNILFTGSKGTMKVEWDKVTVTSLTGIPNETLKGLYALGIEEAVKPNPGVYEFNAPKGNWSAHFKHHMNFIESIRGNETVKADLPFGLLASAAALLCNVSYERQQVVHWDSLKMKIVG